MNDRKRRIQRVVLVGPTRATMRLLEGPLSERAVVSAVPFPSPQFDRTLANVSPDLLVVDVTYLREERIRPELLHRLAGKRVALVFVSDAGGGWVDDLRTQRSWPIDDTSAEALLRLIDSPPLRLVQAR
jgi:hypothetical protein